MQLTNSVAVALIYSAALTAALPQASSADSLMPRANIVSMIKSAEQKIGSAGEELESWLKDYFTGKFANLPIIQSNMTTAASPTPAGDKKVPAVSAPATPADGADEDEADAGDSEETQNNDKRDMDTEDDEDDDTEDLEVRSLEEDENDDEVEDGELEARSLDEEADENDDEEAEGLEELEARGLSSIFKGKKKPVKPGKGKGNDAPPGVVKGKHQGYCGWPKKSYPKSMGGGTDGRMFCIFVSRVGVCTSCQEGKHKEFDECWC